SIGAVVDYDEVLPGRPNVIGRFPGGADGKPRVLLGPHTDTVTVANMTIPPFGAEIRDGRLYGRGASDTKGSMAAMLWALREVGGRIPELGVEISFVGFMSEETGQHGSRDFARRYGNDYDFAIIGEPTGLDIVHVHKGCTWATIATRGRAAHGATPEDGENAIAPMARLVEKLDTRFREELAEFDDPLLGPSTLNIGMISGGVRLNIVPDYCELGIDIRSTPALDSGGGSLELLRAFLSREAPEAELLTRTQGAPSLDTDPGHPLVERLVELGAQPIGAPWFCDAAILAEAGIPAVALGPGSIAQAHTHDEWIALKDLEAGVDFFVRFLESFA
ncbi:MAG: M20 family metallopeptidase, partial [Verrucomicrobiales bacterium]